MPQMLCGSEEGRLAPPGDKEPTLGPGAILSPYELWVGSGVQITGATNLITPRKTAVNELGPSGIPLSFGYFFLGEEERATSVACLCPAETV